VILVDANLLIYATNRDSPHHRQARNWLEQAIAYVDDWLNQPFVTLISPGEHHWPIFSNLLKSTGVAGNLISDVHVAALAIEHGAEIYSADYDFKRFAEITHINPLA